MITPPTLLFYISLGVLLIGWFKVFFKHEKVSEDEVFVVIGAGVYIFVYLVVWSIMNIPLLD